MGMRIVLMTLGDANRERLLRDPELVRSAVSRDDEDDDDEAGSVRGTIELAGHEGQILDLDKAWGAIHYLLTGTAWEGEAPQNFLLCGGEQVGDVDLGLGPARSLSAEATRGAAAMLQSGTDAELRTRFDPADMKGKEIYPDFWDESDPNAELDYVLEHLAALRAFVERAAAKRMGLLIWLS